MLRLTDRASSRSSHEYEATLYFDGATDGSNPSEVGGCGWVIYSSYDDEEEIVSGSERLTGADFPWAAYQCTNNQAEYMGLLRGLEAARNEGIRRLKVRGDSQLVIRQMNDEYAVRKNSIKKLFHQCSDEAVEFQKISFEHVYRDRTTGRWSCKMCHIRRIF